MGAFVFSSKSDTIGTSPSFKTFVVPSPDKSYSVIMKYFRYEKLSEGDFKTQFLPNFYSELHLYVRKKDEETFSVFKYNGNVCVHRHIKDNFTYDDITNLEEVSSDVMNAWGYLAKFI